MSTAISPAKRRKIATVGHSFYRKNIWWTWVDQLDYKGWSWSGRVSDIDETRCDGIIEYCYESQGVRVCGGTNGSRWNISRVGRKYPENHNDFHNHRWNPGEICPAVQGGGHGRGTLLRKLWDVTPTVTRFDVIASQRGRGPSFPELQVSVNAPDSEVVFVRIAVRKERGRFHFLVGRKRILWFSFRSTWQFRQTSAGALQRVDWLGETSGPNFRGQDGRYEFRVVAVDRAGNVSTEYSKTVTVVWP